MRAIAALLLLLIGAIVVFSIAGGNTATSPGAVKSTDTVTIIPPEARAAAQATNNFRIVSTAWQKGGFGLVAVADFTFANDNSVPVKDVTVSCIFYAASGTRLGTGDQIIYQSFPAKKSTKAAGVNLGFINSQSAAASCDVESVVPIGDPTFDNIEIPKPANTAPVVKPNLRPANLAVQP
jgi:hypothetical protein